MKNLENIKHLVTHGSIFHADDLFATALLQLITFNTDFKRIVKLDEAKDLDLREDTLVYDIGEGEYDHHQKDKALRPIEDGTYITKDGTISRIPYCSFGLLWRDYGRELCLSDKAWAKVDRDLVLPIDKADNGVEHSTLSAAVHAFNPIWNMDEDSDENFSDVLVWAKKVLMRYVLQADAETEASEFVKNSEVVDGHILVLEKFVPWQDTVIESMPDILYVCFPSNRGGWNVQTVPDAPGSFNGRKLFPTRWLGNPDKALGMTFCHPGNFLLATENREQAISCARIAAAE